MSGTVGCVFVDDIKCYPSVSPDDCKHPKLPETTARPYPPGVHVMCHQLNDGHHPTNVYFREAHPHFDIDSCSDCGRFKDCGQAEGRLSPGS